MIKKRITLCVMCLLGLYASVWAQSSGGTPPDEGAATYTINFNGNKGSGSTDVNGEMASQSVTQMEVDDGATLTPSGYSRDGYTFSGWATTAGGDKVYDDQVQVSMIAFSAGQTTIELYAVWTANTYTVQFVAGDGGGGQMESQLFTYDVTQNLAANTFFKTGYHFAGWKMQGVDDKLYKDEEPVSNLTEKANETVILEAQWEANRYTLSLHKNHAEATGEEKHDLQVVYGSGATLESDKFTLTGHTITAWTTVDDGSGTSYAYGSSADIADLADGATRDLYAQWTALFQGFTLHLDQNGSSSPDVPDVNVEQGDKDLTVPECSFTRRGYVFTNWNTEEDGSGMTVTPGETTYGSLYSYVVEGQLTLYARWRPINYIIQYDSNPPAGVDKSKIKGEMPDQTLTWDTPAVISDPKQGVYELEGYNLELWCVQPTIPEEDENGNVYEKGEEVINILPEGEVSEGQKLTLYAQWEDIVYGVRFHSNADDAEGGMEMQSIRYDEHARLKACTITRPGYMFACWSTHPDVTEPNDTVPVVNVYADQAEVYQLSTEKEGEVNLYAHWQPITYEVVFDANRGEGNVGEGVMANQTFTYATPQALTRNTFTRQGYQFASWNLLPDGSGRSYADEAMADSLVTEQGKTRTLYAQWTPNTYLVHFDKHNDRAVGSMEDQTHTYDASLALATNTYTHPDSVFLGWVTDPAETETILYQNGETVSNLTADGEVTLYAQWGNKEYFVRFLPNGADAEQTTQRFIYTEPEKLDPCPFTRTGYTFRGWALTATGAVRYDDKAEVTGLTDEAGGVVPLYAVWEENTYTVHFRPATDEISDYMPSVNLRYSEQRQLPANTYTRLGHSFKEWNTRQNGMGTTYADEQQVQGISAVNGDEITLYALWRRHSYRLHYEANGGKGTMADQQLEYNQAETALTQNAFIREGYSFTGWDAVIGGKDMHFTDGQPVQNLTAADDTTLILTAGWREHSYTLRFHRNVSADDEPIDQQLRYSQSATLRSNTFTYTGYTFTGWAESPDGEKAYDNNATVKALTSEDGKVIDLYARWTPNRYTVAFNANSGAGEMEALSLVYDGETAFVPGNGFTRTGYVFTGWNSQANGRGTVYTVGQELHNLTAVPDGEITLYAQWKARTYTVRYDANGGEGAMADLPMTYDETAVLAANAFTRTGHTYTGWNTRADGTGTSYADRAEVRNWTDKDAALITLYAQWRAHTYTVLYVANGGDGDMDNQAFVYGRAQALTANAFTREGHTFSGWNTKMNGTGTAYADGQEVSDLSAKDGDFVGLYAQWTPLQYNVVFKNDDGTALQSGKCDYGTTPVYGGETPVKPSTAEYDYVFTGWTPELAPVTGDTEYTAVYRAERRSYTVSFVSEGETLQSDLLEYGSTPYYRGDDPVKPSTAEYDYVFTGWTPELAPVTGDAVYTAVFEETGRTYLHGTQAGGMIVRTEALHIYVSGIADSEEVTVFDLNGRQLYRGIGRDIEVPATGLYMLCRAGETLKVMVR